MADDERQRLAHEIAQLRSAIDALKGLPDTQAPLLEQLAEKQRRLDALRGAADGPAVSAPSATRDVNIATNQQVLNVAAGGLAQNFGTVIFGRDPSEDERRRVGWYLQRLANVFRQLPLRGLDERLTQGDGLALPDVYIMLATESRVEVVRGRSEDLWHYYQHSAGLSDTSLRMYFHPDYSLPDRAIVAFDEHVEEDIEDGTRTPVQVLLRSCLVTEAICKSRQMVLLGDPGSGKSTVARYLAWAVARRGLGRVDEAQLHGWEDAQLLLPVFVSLRALAGRLARDGVSDATVKAALIAALHDHCADRVDDVLSAALHRGAALLLLDGLDEVPVAPSPGQHVGRAATVAALQAFLQGCPQVYALLTCRTRAFSEDLRAVLGWPVEMLAPLTLGQIRQFIPAWYRELAEKGQVETQRVEGLSKTLLDVVVGSERLLAMARNPLLLTMMAVVLYNKGELPRDRPLLYERILELLLGQWDTVHAGQSLSQALGLPEWDGARFAPLLDRLSYEAHRLGSSEDGRGRLARAWLYKELIDFFEGAKVVNPGDTALRWLAYVDQRSGLLAPDATDSYVFAHLTLQEHCAGRYLVTSKNSVERILDCREEDRWRAPIMLGLGVIQATNPWLIEGLLRRLVALNDRGHTKRPDHWYHDLILMGEIGEDRNWDRLQEQGLDVFGLKHDLQVGLARLLSDARQPISVIDRLRAGRFLSSLGDSRYPIAEEAWRAEVARRNERFGQPDGYFCYVPSGAYQIGGWVEGQEVTTLTLQQFWVARLPVTVAQYALFVEKGYSAVAQRWWTPAGWMWKGMRTSTATWGDVSRVESNQPVTGVTFYEATAFCAWLNDQLLDCLPIGYRLRLPTEAEWEVAAVSGRGGNRRPYPWNDSNLSSELAIHNTLGLQAPAPVGCCPAGAATCGALDLVGNVWELLQSSYQGYPAKSETAVREFSWGEQDVPLRGGAWTLNETSMGNGARWVQTPHSFSNDIGFRLVLAPKLS